jgi:hypothetical protein
LAASPVQIGGRVRVVSPGAEEDGGPRRLARQIRRSGPVRRLRPPPPDRRTRLRRRRRPQATHIRRVPAGRGVLCVARHQALRTNRLGGAVSRENMAGDGNGATEQSDVAPEETFAANPKDPKVPRRGGCPGGCFGQIGEQGAKHAGNRVEYRDPRVLDKACDATRPTRPHTVIQRVALVRSAASPSRVPAIVQEELRVRKRSVAFKCAASTYCSTRRSGAASLLVIDDLSARMRWPRFPVPEGTCIVCRGPGNALPGSPPK